jgi:pyruvate kinase
MQPGLQALGLSTLGRSEAHVMPSLDAAIVSLARIAGLTEGQYPETEAFPVGTTTLLENQSRIFGKDPAGPRIRRPPEQLRSRGPGEAVEDSSECHEAAELGQRPTTGLEESGFRLRRPHQSH